MGNSLRNPKTRISVKSEKPEWEPSELKASNNGKSTQAELKGNKNLKHEGRALEPIGKPYRKPHWKPENQNFRQNRKTGMRAFRTESLK